MKDIIKKYDDRYILASSSIGTGGFIGLADCGKDHGYVPQENIDIMCETFKRYGKSMGSQG